MTYAALSKCVIRFGGFRGFRGSEMGSLLEVRNLLKCFWGPKYAVGEFVHYSDQTDSRRFEHLKAEKIFKSKLLIPKLFGSLKRIDSIL